MEITLKATNKMMAGVPRRKFVPMEITLKATNKTMADEPFTAYCLGGVPMWPAAAGPPGSAPVQLALF
jgi:hypothetical protein